MAEYAESRPLFRLLPARAATISRLGMTTIKLSYNPHDQ